MTTFDYGPIGFEGDRPGPGVLQAIDDLVAAGIVNLLDLVFARRGIDGELEVLELSDALDDDAPALDLDLAGIAGENDIEALAASVPRALRPPSWWSSCYGPSLSARRCTTRAASSSPARASPRRS